MTQNDQRITGVVLSHFRCVTPHHPPPHHLSPVGGWERVPVQHLRRGEGGFQERGFRKCASPPHPGGFPQKATPYVHPEVPTGILCQPLWHPPSPACVQHTLHQTGIPAPHVSLNTLGTEHSPHATQTGSTSTIAVLGRPGLLSANTSNFLPALFPSLSQLKTQQI